MNNGPGLSVGNIAGVDQMVGTIQASNAAALGLGSPGIRTIALDGYTLTNVTAVPEPSSVAVLLTLAIGRLIVRRKR
ncbi:PEP-CTERM sorting domain-containing protein [Rubripirellula amarantea]|uniref:PEP-CTERM sorting domain-containing protein n=1 Tax=Rubripirellula amarantea TaxID=2527999 RepID=UPI0011B47761|nr:PEP-CTERM sorting domain-containing protein [Rubripirellula amarantea]